MKRLSFLFVSCFTACLGILAQTGIFFPSDRFSSGLISKLCQDQQGMLWIGTDYGLNRYDGYNFHSFLHDASDSTSLSSSVVVSLCCDREGNLWVGTSHGLDRYDPAGECFHHYAFPRAIKPRVNSILQQKDGTLLVATGGYGAFALGEDGQLRDYDTGELGDYPNILYEDKRGWLWMCNFDDMIVVRSAEGDKVFHSIVGAPTSVFEQADAVHVVCQRGMMTYRNGSMKPTDADMSVITSNDVLLTDGAASRQGDIYIGTRGKGVFRIAANGPRRLERVDIDAASINVGTAKVNAMLFDRRGNFWMSCQRKGLLMVPQRPMQFSSWSFDAQGIRLGSTISSVCEGDGDRIWCTVQGVGVYGFDRRGRVVAHPASPDAVEFIFRDKQRRYWIGTDDGLYAYDPLTGHYELRVTFECDKFNDMTSDEHGNIFISTFSRGFCVYNPASGQLHNYSIYDTADSVRGRLCNNWVMGMATDSQGLLWMATSSGVACFDPTTTSFRSQGWESVLAGIMCYDVCELADGNIAIGTDEGLYLYDRTAHTASIFPGSEQLANKVVNYIVQSNDGDIWCSTSQGIWQYSQKKKVFIGHVNGNGLTQKEYIYGVGMHTNDDYIFFGQPDGLTVFQPRDIHQDGVAPMPLQLTSFCVGDQYVNARSVINDVQVTGGKGVRDCDEFTLSYLDHTVTLAFSQLDFDNPMNVTLEYSVNGGSWMRNAEGMNEVRLGHLQPGTYHIEVRALQSGQLTPSKVITVVIKSPWYSTRWAYLLYAVALIALLYYMQRTFRRRTAQQLNEEKMKFLINATHDIRSPLTIILSALKKLKSMTASGEAIDTIERNSQRILNLVNQILDVRKIDKQQMQLHCQQTDMVAFVAGICKMFEFTAKERGISFMFLHEGIERLDAWVDTSQFDKVVTNLLSNAFKYCAEQGEVVVKMKKGEQTWQIEVYDNGMGLDSDSLKHLFDRFYQGSNSRQTHVAGTGIGLNLCKMIVDMHQGTIEANNRTGTKGAVLTVTMPLGNSHLKPEEMSTDTPTQAIQTATAPTTAPTTTSRHRVLIADDDVEIGHYIQQELGKHYKMELCHNGKEALKELLTNEYDIVISDVMMPEMDGFTLLRMIKTNMNISHLPVIMLTSKADVGNRLEGLERGADAFLAKPFDMEELHLTIENLLQTRQRLKGKFSGAQKQQDKVEQVEVKGNDELLMERIMKAVNKYLGDSDFNVEMLTQEVGISRAQLHRKMKELTGLSTSEFIRNIRLEQAARLLKEQKINVTQVAYTVGFSNLAHFSTIFRRHFGVSPSEYAES